jgi:prophage maintenance system killer protein/prophage antirepressor-like protein
MVQIPYKREPQSTELQDSNLVIYQIDNQQSVEVYLQNETLWLTQEQIASLFGRERSVITKHLRNIFKTGEVDEESNVQKMHIASSDKPVRYYSLDAIISVGYRVNSIRGTQFRIWATGVLKNYLIQGYAVNERRLKEQAEKLDELQRTIQVLRSTIENYELTADTAHGLLRVITDYSYALDLLDRYDHQTLEIADTRREELYRITYEEAIEAIRVLQEQFGGSVLFGREKDASFRSSLGAIYQSFDGEDLYPSIEEKAAHLLYFVVKNHSFSDGNKRIAAFLFTWFLDRNIALYREDGTRRIADNALVAITLMVAESRPQEKDTMTRLIVNLINIRN